MTLGKIKSTNTRNEQGEFNGMDVIADFVNDKNKMSQVSFHYLYYSNDLRGLVEQVLSCYVKGTLSNRFSNVTISK